MAFPDKEEDCLNKFFIDAEKPDKLENQTEMNENKSGERNQTHPGGTKKAA